MTAIAFANKLSIDEGLTPVYGVTVGGTPINWEALAYDDIPDASDNDWDAATADWDADGYRLPTEMEWMWAAMGVDQDAKPGDRSERKCLGLNSQLLNHSQLRCDPCSFGGFCSGRLGNAPHSYGHIVPQSGLESESVQLVAPTSKSVGSLVSSETHQPERS